MSSFLIIAAAVIAATAATPGYIIPPPIGGLVVAKIEEVPYQVSVQLNRVHHCGGVIIAEKFVLTAAACVNNNFPHFQYTIRSGSLVHSLSGMTHEVVQIIIHSRFHVTAENIPVNDIALIKIRYPFIFDGTRDAIPLLLTQSAVSGSVGQIIGWGGPIDSPTTYQLKKGSVIIEDKTSCNRKEFNGRITEDQICANSIEKSPCALDGGGPLVVGVHLAGIISWSKNCGKLSVYTDIYAHRNWITYHLKN